ncbi:YybH family protein [Tunturiibacter gelidiferens]|uniref:YybH family protein n=1 Tax=Tunturiibacter gelidiferens TaxID=3069689 RepID=UPI003D9BD720
MNRRQLLTAACCTAPSMFLSIGNGQSKPPASQLQGSPDQKESLRKTGAAIRSAFAKGDVDEILAYHHPEVIKALSYQNYIVGIDALRANLLGTFQAVKLEFIENTPETTLFHDGTAAEMSLFTIKSTPKAGGAPAVVKGRSMVVYIVHPASPTGWASIRETVQPAS